MGLMAQLPFQGTGLVCWGVRVHSLAAWGRPPGLEHSPRAERFTHFIRPVFTATGPGSKSPLSSNTRGQVLAGVGARAGLRQGLSSSQAPPPGDVPLPRSCLDAY